MNSNLESNLWKQMHKKVKRMCYELIEVFLLVLTKAALMKAKNPIQLLPETDLVPLSGQQVAEYAGICKTSCQHKCSKAQESAGCTRYDNGTCRVYEKGWFAQKTQIDSIGMIRGILLILFLHYYKKVFVY